MQRVQRWHTRCMLHPARAAATRHLRCRTPASFQPQRRSRPPRSMDAPAALREQLEVHGQGHLLDQWQDLSDAERQELLQDVQKFDFGFVSRVFQASISAAEAPAAGGDVVPCTDVTTLAESTPAQREAWRQHGLDLLAQGKVAVLLLAGGQGTRLGSSAPKGCYDIGLPSHKSLFQIQAERLLKLQQLVAQHAGRPVRPLRWVVMTSPFTHDETLEHFRQHRFFGLQEDQVTFFQQGSMPCLTESGKVILATRSSLAKAPDGNGGVYMSLQQAGVLDLLEQQGVEVLDVYCVDNALVRLGDPLFVGYCQRQGAQVGARVVAKAYPEEKVGVFAKRDDVTCVVEYSEMSPEEASSVDPATGKLRYNWSNVCMHFFTVAWLRQVCAHLSQGAAYHVARKKIPSKDGPVQGIKLELFIFDTFPTASRIALLEVERSQFAPVKNAPGTPVDSPDTARAATLALGAAWVRAAGGVVVDGAEGVEVSPLASYAGEGLEARVAGRTFNELTTIEP